MFKKKKCKNCQEKVNNDYNFCPYCKTPLNNRGEDWGMLGKNDFDEEANEFSNLFGGLGGGMLGKMLNSAVKMLEREMQKEAKAQKSSHHIFGTNMKLMINGKEVDFNGNQKQNKESSKKLDLPSTSSRRFIGLPKAEPKTSIRRLSDKVIYEINMPGVDSINDISISQLESSIEVKALGKKKVYQKIIPINLPISDYNFSKKKLTLELDTKD